MKWRMFITYEYEFLQQADFGDATPWAWCLDNLFRAMKGVRLDYITEPVLFAEDWHFNPYRDDPRWVSQDWDRECLRLIGEMEVSDERNFVGRETMGRTND